jgi:hypothetical protein
MISTSFSKSIQSEVAEVRLETLLLGAWSWFLGTSLHARLCGTSNDLDGLHPGLCFAAQVFATGESEVYGWASMPPCCPYRA